MRNYIAMNIAGQIMDYAPITSVIASCSLTMGSYLLDGTNEPLRKIGLMRQKSMKNCRKQGISCSWTVKVRMKDVLDVFIDYTYILDIEPGNGREIYRYEMENWTEFRAYMTGCWGSRKSVVFVWLHNSREFGYRQLLDVNSFVSTSSSKRIFPQYRRRQLFDVFVCSRPGRQGRNLRLGFQQHAG